MEITVNDQVFDIPHFSPKEFDCHCCGFNNLNHRFLLKLHFARLEAQIPFVINSGCRCRKHNEELIADPNTPHVSKRSEHLYGQAADIKCLNSRNRWLIIESAHAAGFKRIGIARTFIHLGDKWDRAQKVIFLYG